MKTTEGKRWWQKFGVRGSCLLLISRERQQNAEWILSLLFYPLNLIRIMYKRWYWPSEYSLFHPLCNIPGSRSIVFIVVKEFPLPKRQQNKVMNTKYWVCICLFLKKKSFLTDDWATIWSYREATMQQECNLLKGPILSKIFTILHFHFKAGGTYSSLKMNPPEMRNAHLLLLLFVCLF